MKRRVLINSIVDLTPLLDVVFILLFAFLMTMTMEKKVSDEKAIQLTESVEVSKATIASLVEKNIQLDEQLIQLKEQQDFLNAGFVKWFSKEGDLTALKDNEQLMNVFDLEKTSQSLYQMEFIANHFYFINVTVDSKNQYKIIINGETTTYQLNAALFNDQIGKENMKTTLFNYIEKVLSKKDGGYKYVLLTITDDGYIYKYAYELIWEVFGRLESKSENIHKLHYVTY